LQNQTFLDSLIAQIGDSINTDEQVLSISNDTIFLVDGGFVKLPSTSTSSDDQILTISNDTLYIEDGNFVLLEDLLDSNTTANFVKNILVQNGDTIFNNSDFLTSLKQYIYNIVLS